MGLFRRKAPVVDLAITTSCGLLPADSLADAIEKVAPELAKELKGGLGIQLTGVTVLDQREVQFTGLLKVSHVQMIVAGLQEHLRALES